ncbi:hypothetical protein HGRIS_010343 [Hohenbuehelia grisea]|uniref:Uncharacterized protein n=1 Tax=Hohenbuehelia grisea TaxID=104357 RepID=A0ABR3J4N8_9AGAR
MIVSGPLASIATMEVGTTISTFLFGVSTLQAYTYCLRFPHDRWQIKTLSGKPPHFRKGGISEITPELCRTLELTHVILILHYFFTLSILQYDDLDHLAHKAPASLALACLVDAFISLVVQSFFINRVRKISGQWFLANLCWFLSGLHFVARIAISVFGLQLIERDFLVRWRWLVVSTSTIAATTDILVAVALTYDLVKKKRSVSTSSSSNRTMQILDHLIVSALMAWIAIFVCLARVFTNSFFAALNSRRGAHGSRVPTALQSIVFAKSGDLRGSQSHVVTFHITPSASMSGSEGTAGVSDSLHSGARDASWLTRSRSSSLSSYISSEAHRRFENAVV